MIIFQWNFIWNSNIYIKENAFEHVVCKMAAILSIGRWVEPVMINSLRPSEGFMGPWPGLFLVLLMDCPFGDKPLSENKKNHVLRIQYLWYRYIIQASSLKCVWKIMTSPNEKFSALLAFREGNSPVTGEFPSQKPVTRSFDIFLIWAWTNGWANNQDAIKSQRVPFFDIVFCNKVTLHGGAWKASATHKSHLCA